MRVISAMGASIAMMDHRQLRAYHPADAEVLAAVYKDAVRGTGASAYDAQQIAVWSAYPEDIEAFRHLLNRGITLVAVQGERVVAFGQLNPPDHIAFLYTATAYARLGYASEIYRQLEAHAFQQGVQRLHTEASRLSQPLFAKMGFHVVETEIVERQGVQIERFKMAKRLC
jgi:putative acetyltransferase